MGLYKKLIGVDGGDEAGKLLVQHKEMRHPWDMQAPQLWVDSVVGWIEKGELPGGFEAC